MRRCDPIADYLDALARALGFDPALARRVRLEAEDHLREAVAQEPGCADAERRAIANFGDPRALARQYAAFSLLAQARRLGLGAVLALVGIFAAMKARIAWYEFTQWTLSDDLKAMNAIGVPLDRYTFLLALALAIIACGYIASRRAPAEFHGGYGRELKRCVILCAAAAGALLGVVGTETVLTGFRLSAAEWPAAAIPALSITAEIACAGALVWQIRRALRRAACAASLLRG